MKPIHVCSWFSGIGGFELGLQMASPRFQVVSQSEIDPYCSRLLAERFKGVPNLGDIKKVRPEDIPEADLWCGGFPCQPFSLAGKREATDDPRDLWPDWFRLIASRRPRWLIGENVPGLLTVDSGQTWGRCIRDLASVGYVGQWRVLGARDVGAPHRRDRLWVVACLADAEVARGKAWSGDRLGTANGPRRNERQFTGPGCAAFVADAEGQPVRTGLRQDEPGGERRGRPDDGGRPECWCGRGEPWCCDPADVGNSNGPSENAQPERCGPRRAVSESGGRLPEPRVGRVAHGVPRRVDRLRGLGNAVVPQVVAAIGRRLLEVVDS